MVTNVNEPVWTTQVITHVGGGVDASFHIPADIDISDWSLSVPAATTADIELAQNTEEEVHGINERPLRYAQVALNDLGGSGELRMNAAAGQDFTDDGWAIGDSVEVVSHRVPAFGPERTHPTTLGDVQVYTLTAVSALVLAFSEDPAFALSEGDILVAQSRAALLDAELNWVVEDSTVGAADVTRTVQSAHTVRINVSAGTGTVTYKVDGRHQSRERPAPFVVHANPGPYGGQQSNVGVALPSVADGTVVVWDEVVTAGPNASRRQARATISGATFVTDGVQNFDRLFFGGHSVTGNGGTYTVDSRLEGAVTMKEPLRGSAGTDTPGRVKLRHFSAVSRALLASDYTELVLTRMGPTLDMYFYMQDGILSPPTSIGPHQENLSNSGSPVLDLNGPFGDAEAFAEASSSEWEDGNFATQYGASEEGGMEGWFRMDRAIGTELFMMYMQNNGPTIGVTSAGEVFADLEGVALADPGAWLATTAYSQGDRVRAVADNSRVAEAEVGGTSGACEPVWPTDGSTVVDNTVTWRDVGLRADFHQANTTNGERLLSGVTLAVGDWVYVAMMRPADGTWRLYVNGAKVGTLDGGTGPGSFGTPVRFDFTVAQLVSQATLMSNSAAGAEWNGAMTHVAYYDQKSLTDAEVQAHYDKAVEIGLNT